MGILNLDKRLVPFLTCKTFAKPSKNQTFCNRFQMWWWKAASFLSQPRWIGSRNALESPSRKKYSWKEKHDKNHWARGEGTGQQNGIMTIDAFNYFIFQLKTKLLVLQPDFLNSSSKQNQEEKIQEQREEQRKEQRKG